MDLSKPIVIEHELSEGEIRATIAGRTVTAKSAAAADRRAFPFLAVNGMWKLIEWRMWDLDATPQSPQTAPQPGPAPSTSWHGWPADAPQPAIAPFDAAQAKKHQEEWAAYLKVPVEYTNSIGMKFRLIPPGEFTMGSPTTEIDELLKIIPVADERWRDTVKSESPQHKVTLTMPIYLGIYEVTQQEFEAATGSTPSHFSNRGREKASIAAITDTSRHPVEGVSWNEVIAFCSKLDSKEQLSAESLPGATSSVESSGYRLPTEAEWEFACRAGTTTRFWSGKAESDLLETAFFNGNAESRTHAAGELKPNPFGLFDMHGNVWEWCLDGWTPTFYQEQHDWPTLNPSGPSLGFTRRIVHGGSFINSHSYCASSRRLAHEPTSSDHAIGFRAAVSVDAVKQALSRPASASTTSNRPIPANRPIDASTRWSTPVNLGPGVNSAVREANPSLTNDELLLVFTRAGELYQARRARRDQPFDPAIQLPLSFTTAPANTTACLSGDGLLLAFNSNAMGEKQEDVMLCSRASRDEPFGPPVRLPQPINSDASDRHPVLSPDGLSLALTTNRPGIKAGSVLIFHRASRDADFSTTPLIDPQLQIAWDTVSSFASDGSGVLKSSMFENREQVTWHARSQPDGPFAPGIPLGPPLDGLKLSVPFLSADGQTLYFHSRGLPGSHGDLDLWMTRRLP